jgi:hypothetical protein
MVEFIREIGIPVERGEVTDGLLPGLAARGGALVVDEARLAYPGDLLHEAGHLAVADPSDRGTMNAVGDDPAEEMAALAWSYAAVRHLSLDPSVVFHRHGYGEGGGAALIAAFQRPGGPGVPMLKLWGMTGGSSAARHFPTMLRWLR